MEGTSYPQAWNERVGGFATAIGKPIEEVTKALEPVTGEPSDDAVAILANATAAPDEDIKAALKELNIPSGKFNMHVSKLRGPVAAIATDDRAATLTYDSILPTVPEDQSFIEMLKTGGVLKVGTVEVLSAIKAAIANKLHLFDLPDVIKKKMEAFAEDQDEPVGEEFFKLQKLVVTRSYAEVLSAMGVEGRFMSESRKNSFLAKLDANLWSSLHSFHKMLTEWITAWSAGATSPAALTILLMGQQTGKSGTPMPPGIMTPPETVGLHDEAEAVINNINKVFAGVGIPVARALAYDATQIKNVLQEKSLPAAVGAANYDQMIKMLGVNVGADYVRLERNLTRFAMGIMEFPKITDPNDELRYLIAMNQLGISIPWDKLGESGIGKRVL